MKHFVVEHDRDLKAKKIKTVLEECLGKPLIGRKILDIGCGNGEIADFLRHMGNEVTCVDIEDQRLDDNQCEFLPVDSELLPFSAHSFDIVLSNHVIEHVSHHILHLSEISRVLTPRGVCYLATPNRYFIYDAHYKVFFLHWLPYSLFLWVLKKLGKYQEPLQLLGYLRLRSLLKRFFRVREFTDKVIKYPERYSSGKLIPGYLSACYVSVFNIISPTMIFICKKTESSEQLND